VKNEELCLEPEANLKSKCCQAPVFCTCIECLKPCDAELIEHRPKIGNDRIASWAETISDNSNLGVMHIQYLLKAMLNEAGVEFGEANPDSNADKVSGKEAKDGKEKA
jgi:hypothetical protein